MNFGLLVGGAALLAGILGYFLRLVLVQRQAASIESRIQRLRQEAKGKAESLILQARQKAIRILEEAKKEEKLLKQQLTQQIERFEKKHEFLEKRSQEIAQKEELLRDKASKIKEIERQVQALKQKSLEKLESISRLSQDEAKKYLLELVEKTYQSELHNRLKKLEQEGAKQLEERARNIMSLAMERLASPHSSDLTSYTVSLPTDDIKGRIIGKEGRNIRAFEKATGVEVVIDDTPEVVVLSSFSPIRREVARLALERLILDGRIQPALIEKIVTEAKKEVAAEIRKAGEDAIYKLGIVGVDPDLVKILGRLKFRTSYGQNVLEHSIEVARIAEIIASELSADASVAKKAGLFHDIGKAVDHEVQGSHVEIGRRLLQKFGIAQEVIEAMQSHHQEYEPTSLEAVIVQVADAISGARPGARRASLEEYLQRLEDLEKITDSFKGVQRSFAIQAGREVRVFVEPDQVSDYEAKKLAREIAAQIEAQLKYPGEIKVNVIRERRVVAYAR